MPRHSCYHAPAHAERDCSLSRTTSVIVIPSILRFVPGPQRRDSGKYGLTCLEQHQVGAFGSDAEGALAWQKRYAKQAATMFPYAVDHGMIDLMESDRIQPVDGVPPPAKAGLAERVREVQELAAQLGCQSDSTDTMEADKAFIDEMWGED